MIIVAAPDLDQLLVEPVKLPSRLAAALARSEVRSIQRPAWASELVVDQPVSVAPLTRLLDRPDDCQGIWLRADPVRLTPDLNAVWMTPGAALEADHALTKELQDLVGESDSRFDLPHPERGYLKLSSVPDCRFVPPDELEGQSLDHVLPSGPDARFWRRLLNECQIIAHQHGRESGADGPGGLWFWGPGSLPASSGLAPRVQRLVGRDPIWAALARWLNLDHTAAVADSSALADASLAEWLADVSVDRAANLAAFDAWLKPLWRRIRLGKLDALEIASRTRVWRLTPKAAWRFWRASGVAAT